MLAWSMGGVGLIDITVGNGAPRRINVPPRDAARRTTSLRNARAAGDILASLARLARARLWLRAGHMKRMNSPLRAVIERRYRPER
jgi:hypothetical protein